MIVVKNLHCTKSQWKKRMKRMKRRWYWAQTHKLALLLLLLFFDTINRQQLWSNISRTFSSLWLPRVLMYRRCSWCGYIHDGGRDTVRSENTHLAATNSRDKGTRDYSKWRKKRLPVRIITFHFFFDSVIFRLSEHFSAITDIFFFYASLSCQAEQTTGSIISFSICYIIWIIFRYHPAFLLLWKPRGVTDLLTSTGQHIRDTAYVWGTRLDSSDPGSHALGPACPSSQRKHTLTQTEQREDPRLSSPHSFLSPCTGQRVSLHFSVSCRSPWLAVGS